MTKKLILPSEVEEARNEDNVIALKPEFKDNDGDWLWGLPLNSVFLMCQKPIRDQYGHTHYDHNLGEFHVINKVEAGTNRSVKLLSNMNEETFSWVSSRIFSKNFDLQQVLLLGKEEEVE